MKKYFVLVLGVLLFYILAKAPITFGVTRRIINEAAPIIKIVNSKDSEKVISYVNVLKNKGVNGDVFIELPEDKVELEENKIEDNEIKESDDGTKLVESIDAGEPKAVTLEWSRILKNETKYNINVEDLINENLDFKLKNKNTEVIIYHTHTTESYTKSKDYQYESSGKFRTLNDDVNVTRIGREIKQYLEKNKLGVYHDQTVYDYPSYNLSYSKAGKAITELTKKYSSEKIVLDIHRDAIGMGTEQYKPIIKVNGKNAAQFLIVIGTDQGGLKHPNWRENLKLALKIKTIADDEYPGLCRYVILRKERFNQQVSTGAMIVEIGATGNTVEEVLETSRLFSELLIKATI